MFCFAGSLSLFNRCLFVDCSVFPVAFLVVWAVVLVVLVSFCVYLLLLEVGVFVVLAIYIVTFGWFVFVSLLVLICYCDVAVWFVW